MVSYKRRYRQNKLKIEELTGKNKSMKELATEYFEAAKSLRSDLDHQAKLTESLEVQLKELQASARSAVSEDAQAPTNSLSQSKINSLVEQRARKYVLDLKAHFEMRIKRKNDLIRKLRASAGIEGKSTNGSGLRPPNHLSNGNAGKLKQDHLNSQS
jgi:chromosome segregation ATPase